MSVREVAKVLQDFLTTNEGELCLKKGDIVQINKEIDRHWCYGSSNGKVGNVPLNYLIIMDTPPLQKDHSLFAAAADFPGQQAGDLTFSKGELIIGVKKIDENWWQGKIDDTRSGIFPTTYTWQLDSTCLKIIDKATTVINKKARVTMNMKAQLEEEMDLIQGEIITLTEIIDKDWYRGECGNRKGIFPSAYVSILDESSFLQTSDALNKKFNVALHAEGERECSSPFGRNMKQQPSSVDCDDLSILEDDYFKQNIPCMFPTEKNFPSTKVNTESAYSENQPFMELDIIPYGITLYPFYAQFDNELNFHEGEIVTLIRHISKDWIEGEIDGSRGIFPSNYVNVLVDCNTDLLSSNVFGSNLSHKADDFFSCLDYHLVANSFALVLFNFDAQMNGDLSVKSGEVVCIVKIINQDWCEVKNHKGDIGLCPQNYLTPYSMPNKLKSSSYQRYSLTSDSMLQDSSNNVNVLCTNIGLSRRTYMRDDFKQNDAMLLKPDNIDDLIFRNLNSLKFETSSTLNAPYSRRNSTDHIKSPEGMMDTFNSERNSSLISEQQKEEVTLENTCRNLTPETPCSSHAVLNPSRSAPPIPLECTVSLPLQQPVKKRTSDRLPHRPAPPVPLPGQKPIRRSINLKHRKSTAIGSVYKQQNTSSEGCEDLGCEDNKEDHDNSTSACILETEERNRNFEKRQNVLSELVITEKEYVRDLKITYETFNLHNPEFLGSRRIDVKVVFGNMIEVMLLAEEFLDKLFIAMKGKDENDQCIGPCFLEHADRMKCVYGEYCMNHDDALVFLEKYENDDEIQKIFNKGLETLRYQIACFDMGSILIKPVQRILKYPLILNELIKSTEDSHKDKSELLKAVKTMMEVATYINEYKRRKDIVSKYLEDDNNTTISSKMAKLSLHSVAKKSTRLGVLFTSSLGFGAVTKDSGFHDHEALFHSIEKVLRTFLRNIEIFVQHLCEVIQSQYYTAEGVAQFYQERNVDVEEFASIQMLTSNQFWKEFNNSVQYRVMNPLHILLELFEGPGILIQKRNDKFLDYNACYIRAEKNKDIRLVQEELLIAKNNYEALNSHLLEELPTLLSLSRELFVECLLAFVTARKLFTGKVTKQYLALLENSLKKSNQGDPLELFGVKHSLVLNQLSRLGFLGKSLKLEHPSKKMSRNSPTLTSRHSYNENQVNDHQTSSQQVYLQSRYASNMLHCVIKPCVQNEPLELNLKPGNVVAVLKKQNPMGDSSSWFVDNGASQGFVPSCNLEPFSSSSKSSDSLSLQDYVSNHISSQQPISRHSSTSSCSFDFGFEVSTSSVHPKHHVTNQDDEQNIVKNIYEELVSEPTEEESSEMASIVQENEFYYALYDFEDSDVQTLAIKTGQVVKVLQQHDLQHNSEWWFVEDRFQARGFVPSNFLGKYNH